MPENVAARRTVQITMLVIRGGLGCAGRSRNAGSREQDWLEGRGEGGERAGAEEDERCDADHASCMYVRYD